MKQNNSRKYALQSLERILQTDYDSEIFYLDEFKNLSDREKQDEISRRAQKYFCRSYDREKRYLIILQRDLESGYKMINELGIEKSKGIQKFWDFIVSFEDLKEKMLEFHWSAEFLKENGIDFKLYRKLYFSVA